MNTKKFIVWSLLLAAIVVAIAAETSVDNKKEGAKQVEIPTVDNKNNAKDSLNQGDVAVENKRDPNYEVEQWRGGDWWGGGGPGWWGGGGPGWRGGGWRGGGGPGWWGGGGPGWRGGGWRGGGGPGWWGGGGPGWWGGGW